MQSPVSRQAPLAACRYAEAASFRRFTGRYERLKYLAHFPCQDTSLDVAPTYLFSGGIAAAPSVAGRATSSGGRRTEVWYRAWTAGRVGAGGGGGGCRCLPEGFGAAAVLCRLRCCRARAHQGRSRRSLKAEPTESAETQRFPPLRRFSWSARLGRMLQVQRGRRAISRASCAVADSSGPRAYWPVERGHKGTAALRCALTAAPAPAHAACSHVLT